MNDDFDFRSPLIAASAEGVEHHRQLFEMVRHGFLSQESKGELLTIIVAFETFVKVFILEFPCVRNLPSFSSHSTIPPNQPRSKFESWSEIKFFVSFVSIMSTRKPD